MIDIIENVRAIMPFFLASWGVFLFFFIRKPQRLRNCYLLMIALLFTAFMGCGLFGSNMSSALIILVLLTMLAIFMVPLMLIADGIYELRKESRSLAHMLSLLLGIFIGIGEIACVVGVFTTVDFGEESMTALFLGFVFISVFYFSVVILAFVLYVLFIQFLPHRMNFEYVIIHGAGLIRGDQVSRLLANRIDKAIEVYYKCKVKPMLIPSGGQGGDETISEAAAMKKYLLEKGIPEEHILMEDRSKTTRENLRYSKELIEERGGSRRIALISSNYHVYRCLSYASELKLRCTGIGAKVALYYWPGAVIREFVAVYSQKRYLISIIVWYVILILIPELILILS